MNTLVTPVKVARRVTERLYNKLKFGHDGVDRSYSAEFAQTGAKIGSKTNVRLPQRYQVAKGEAMSPVPVTDQTVAIEVTDQANIGISFSMADLTLNVDDYTQRYVDPAVDSLVNTFDLDGMTRMAKETPNYYGTPGVIPGSTGTLPLAANIVYLLAGVKMTDLGVDSDRTAFLNPLMTAYLSAANQSLQNPAAAISANFRDGQFGGGGALGIQRWYETQNVYRHTIGALGGTPLVNGASQTGAAIITDGWTSAAARRLKKGDVVQFATVYAINPLNYQSTGTLMDFTVTADAYSDGSGNLTIPIYPPIVDSGPFQNVTNAPANNDPVTVFGHASSYAGVASPQALITTKGAYAAVVVDLDKPQGVWMSERISNKKLNLSIRIVKQYNIANDQSPARMDLMYGFKAIRPEKAIRVVG